MENRKIIFTVPYLSFIYLNRNTKIKTNSSRVQLISAYNKVINTAFINPTIVSFSPFYNFYKICTFLCYIIYVIYSSILDTRNTNFAINHLKIIRNVTHNFVKITWPEDKSIILLNIFFIWVLIRSVYWPQSIVNGKIPGKSIKGVNTASINFVSIPKLIKNLEISNGQMSSCHSAYFMHNFYSTMTAKIK